ncbi:MAG: IS701 family transposase [Sporocytophaga sp.]|nr:IS701 family transposase [Sporocytophaga sp.]
MYIGERHIAADAHSIHHMLASALWSFRKKGDNSACVGRQYLGCIGKHDNGQVGVTVALSSEDYYTPVDMRLFMPEDWAKDEKRRKKTNFPDHIKHGTKPKMALNMILKLYKKIKQLEYVVFDALHGSSFELLEQLMKRRIPFVGDVRENITVYLTSPQMIIPENKGRGRKNKLPRPNKERISIRDYQKTLSCSDYQKVALRKTTQGPLSAYFHKRKVLVLCKESGKLLPLQLIIRKNMDGSIQYALGYHPIKTTLIGMAKAQAQRVFIERVFEEGKNIVGMADYQVRSWQGCHRHMALCSLALLFLMEQKLLLARTIVGKVTAYQLQELINTTIQTVV